MRDYQKVVQILVDFLRDYLEKSGAKNLLLGVSGGIDSAVVATLCKLATPQTHALLMPTSASNPQNLKDGLWLCENLGIEYQVIDIEPIINAYEKSANVSFDNMRKGNLSARIRMSLLYDRSATLNALVVGTSNKSEIMLGYGTIYGDLACAINPIANLFKTEIYELAKYLKVHQNFITKAPSADLWQGQSDEADLGYSYAKLDEVLSFIDKHGYKALKDKFDDEILINLVISRIEKNMFKTRMPTIAEI
ncbi:NAD+ synthase [Campylobacter mucosalis]|uniref:NAD+ synthase n=1 Tax=Campylobacter mucosalis TaxID=202 RepID=UPI001470152D|nr:NAD+ synthase [Campylobacter mucosalis]